MTPVDRKGHEIRTLNSRGFASLNCWSWGIPENSPVLCVHGLTGNGLDFERLGETLSASGCHVVSPDMPGRGKSGFLDNFEDYRYLQYLHDLHAVMLFFAMTPDRPVDWIGTSMGGLIGIRMAAMEGHPLRCLVLNDIGPFVPEDQLNLIKGYLRQDYRFGTFADLKSYMKETRKEGFGDMSDPDWDWMARHSSRQNPDGSWTFHYDPKISRMFDREPIGETEDLWAFWDRIDIPVLVLRGERSTLFPASVMAEMTRRGPGKKGLMECQTIPGCGHVPPLIADDQIEMIRSWLTRV